MRIAGQIKRLVPEKGFGFISVSGGGGDFFFHRAAWRGTTPFTDLEIGTAVTFEPTDSPKGPRAEEVDPA